MANSDSLRLFIALELPQSVRDKLVKLRGDIPGASWVKPKAMHLTLRFLGDGIPAEQVEPLQDALATVNGRPIKLTLTGVGHFGSKKSPRVLWVGIKPYPALTDLHQQVEAALATVGFAPEDKPFKAHITLARLRKPGQGQAVTAFLDQHDAFREPDIVINDFHLISSELTPQGPNYTYLRSYALGEG